MTQYIYIITDRTSGKKYIGKTTDFKRRKSDHIYQLTNHKHKNYLLQDTYDKYGLDNLQWECRSFDNISAEELNQLEIDLIKELDTYKNGLNLTVGGDGGNTIKRKLDFDGFCFAYFGCNKYQSVTNRTGAYLGVDSSTISAVARKVSYDDYRQLADQLSKEEVAEIIKKFEIALDIDAKPPRKIKPRMSDEFVFKIICVVSSHVVGIEQAINDRFDISKGLMHRCFTKKNFAKAVLEYSKLSEEEVLKLGNQYIEEWGLDYPPLQYKDLFKHYGTSRPNCGV